MNYFGPEDENYLNQTTANISGWLSDYTARVTVAMLNYQREIGVKGSFFEIGVYGGRYLSLLYRASRHDNSKVLAVDPFEHFTEQQIAANIGAPASNNNLHFYKGFSSDFRSADFVEHGKARFISIDGSHDAIDVLEDLRLAYSIIHPKGIIALDDFLNLECFGVIEAVCKFLEEKPGMVPFLYTFGKLFLAPTHAVDAYRDFVERFAAEDVSSPQSAKFTEVRSQNKKHMQTTFFGFSVLTI